MARPLSISSSEPAFGSASAPAASRTDRYPLTSAAWWLRARRFYHLCPHGAVLTLVFMLAFHLVATFLISPEARARPELREKILRLTRDCRPQVIIAGDSRAYRQVIPQMLIDRLGLDQKQVVNISLDACESSAVRAALDEFRGCFADHPILIISVSIWSVNDRANISGLLHDETLWSLPWWERFGLVDNLRAFRSLFLAEKLCYRKLTDRLWAAEDSPNDALGYLAFMNKPVSPDSDAWRNHMQGVLGAWYNQPKIDGLRWSLLQSDLDYFRRQGFQVVVLDAPVHPHFLKAIKGTENASATRQFHRQLANLCRRQGISLLRYEASLFEPDRPQDYFVDTFHLNESGARVLSRAIAWDLDRLVETQVVQWPDDKPLRLAVGGRSHKP